MGFPTPKKAPNSVRVVPDTEEALTAEFFSNALDEKAKNVSIVRVITGTATKILVKVTMEKSNGATTTIPQCAKGGFSTAQKEFGMYSSYRRETLFFYHIAPELAMRTLRAWFSGVNVWESDGQGLLLLDDLAAKGCEFGDCTKPWPAHRVREALFELASLHGQHGERRNQTIHGSTLAETRTSSRSLNLYLRRMYGRNALPTLQSLPDLKVARGFLRPLRPYGPAGFRLKFSVSYMAILT